MATLVSRIADLASRIATEFNTLRASLGALASKSSVNNGDWTGADLAVANGGTGASDAVNARSNLGLVIGTNVQAYHGNLAALAGLTLVADRLPYANGSGTMALATFTAGGRALVNSAGTANTFPYFSAANTVTLGAITAAGRALIDDADAPAQRATLGLGTAAVRNIHVGTSAPSSPAVGDLWVDTN